MKKLLLITIICIITSFIYQIFAQESVNDCILYAKRLQRRMDARNFTKFKSSYAKALEDIAEIESVEDTVKYRYDAIADHAQNWIDLYKELDDFEGGIVKYNGQSVMIEQVDYVPVLEEAIEKASKEHYEDALKVIHSTIIFENRQKVFSHLDKANKYSEFYKDSVAKYKAKVYYDEGLRQYNEDKDFNFRLKTVTFFEKALEFVGNYKDARDLTSKLFYDEAGRYGASTNLTDLRRAMSLYDKAVEYIPDYKDSNAKKMLVKQKGASILYQQGFAKENESTFGAQNEAANFYKRVGEWVNGYKDAAERAKAAELRSTLKILVQDMDGTIMLPNPATDDLLSSANKYITFPKIQHSNIEVSNAANYTKVKEELESGFILIKVDAENIGYSYSGDNSSTSSEKIEKYFMFKRSVKTGKSTEKEITEDEYVKGQKELKASGHNSNSNFRITFKSYTGTLSSTTKSAFVEISYPFSIWDVRDPLHPKLLKDLVSVEKVMDEKLKTTYSGSMKIKPELVDEGRVKAKEDLMIEAKSQNITVSNILKSKEKEILEVLNGIEYVRR